MDFQEYSEAVNAWVQEVQNNRGINAERTLKCCRDIEEYALKTNDAKLLGFAYYYSGETYYVLNDIENLFQSIVKAITYLDQSGQWDLVARAYNIMAITSYNRGNAPIAMDYYLTGLNYCKKYNLTFDESMINQNVGTLYMNLKQYNEAQHYFERSYAYLKNAELKEEDYAESRICIYISLGKCYLYRGMYEKAQEYIDKLERECGDHMQDAGILAGMCFKVIFYHMTGRITLRDNCIEEIHKRMSSCMAIMDVFDDFYEMCQLLVELDKDNELWDIINILEDLAKKAKIINLQRKLIALKIKYYRMHQDNAGYLQAAGLYYELTEMMERENQYMITNMINVRSSLERAKERSRKVEAANKQLQKKSETDQLTGLSNRYRLNDHSEEIFARCKDRSKPLAVEILDIDYFKQYNDNYGHQAGDNCIMAIADQLKKMQNDHIFCARYGGDEFIIIYEGMSEREVFEAADRLRSSIMDLRIEHLYSAALPIVTISQGICYDIPEGENRCWDYLHTADMMLYRVKNKSRNNVCFGRLNTEEIKIGY